MRRAGPGLQAATDDVVLFMDADGSMAPGRPGSGGRPRDRRRGRPGPRRARCAKGAWPPHARLANRYLAWQVGRRTGLDLRDIGPMRAARRTDLLDLGLTDRRFGWPLEMVLRAGRGGLAGHRGRRPVPPREGRSKVTGTVKGTARAVRDMSRILSEL